MSDMLRMIRSLGDQLRWAEQLDVPEVPRASELMVAGMGGSGISGSYVAAVAQLEAGRVSVHKDYSPLPAWVQASRPLVVAVSYSGNTEETLDVVEHARMLGLPIAVVTTGGEIGRLAQQHGWPTVQVPSGLQPRAALGYLFGSVARLAAGSGVMPDPRAHLGEAARIADETTREGSKGWDKAGEVARSLASRIAIVYGGGAVSGAAAGRWKTQINENAKMPAWTSLLPELDHNELVGWEAMPELTRDLLGIVALSDLADHARVGSRLAHSKALTENAVPWVANVSSSGESPIARLISLTAVGDLTSWMMAETAGVDPVPVATIEKLKHLLADNR